MLARLADKVGIEKRVHPHGLRHTHSYELMMEGVPVLIIQQQLGHASLATTDRYLRHIAPKDVVEVMQRREWSVWGMYSQPMLGGWSRVGMREGKMLPVLSVGLLLALTACTANRTTTPASTAAPASTTVPNRTIVVTSIEDDVSGSLRDAINSAIPGDRVEFDESVFRPDEPSVINLRSTLRLAQGDLTIDATSAGVIIDGSDIRYGFRAAIEVLSDNNTIRGVQVRNAADSGIYLNQGDTNLIENNVIVGITDGSGVIVQTSNNTITGNHIGVLADGVTPSPNSTNGISVEEGTRDNTIGPGNVIAFNEQLGIWGATDTVGNSFVQNAIHDNGWGGIAFHGGGTVSAPTITDFDLEAGTVTGTVRAFSTVEVFSDSGTQGAIFEGSTKADGNGAFTFEKGTSLTGPFVTTIATDSEGNSSGFSQRTVGLLGWAPLQEGNNHPKMGIELTPFEELLDNHIGHLNPIRIGGDNRALPVEENFRWLEHVEWGTKWLLTGLDLREIYGREALEEQWYSVAEITEFQDSTVSLLKEKGVTLIVTLNYWDEVLHAERMPDYANEEDLRLFVEHNRQLIRHFKGLIPYYEILNEPNLYVPVDEYIELVRRIIPVIREEDPDVIVVGAVTSLPDKEYRDYLFEILRSDLMPKVDGISFHPFYGESAQYAKTADYYHGYPALLQEIQKTATANGFVGEYIAAEMIWGTESTAFMTEPLTYTYIVATKYYVRSIVTTLGHNVIAGFTGVRGSKEDAPTNPFVSRAIRNISDIMAGAEATEMPIDLQGGDDDNVSYSFELPQGGVLIAVWRDGVAVDHDPGVPSTLVIPGQAGRTATVIDVLFGYEQELNATNEDGGLVIRDLLLMDYPVFIRLGD